MLEKSAEIGEVCIKFDSDLSKEIMISISEATRKQQTPGIPKTLVKDYRIDIFDGAKLIYSTEEKNNIQRYRKHIIPDTIAGDRIRITCLDTHGADSAAVYEVRVYESPNRF